MVWTNNGILWYTGERPITPTPHLTTTVEQLTAANPGQFQPTAQPAYDPMAAVRTKNTRDQLTVTLARQQGMAVQLDASGTVRVAAAQVEDERLSRALEGRTPASKEQLDAWLKASDATLAPDQRMALTMAYEATHGVLPSEGQESPATRQHTLGSLGLRKASRMTQSEFAERLRYHQVPPDQHLKLALAAFEGGHIRPDDEPEAMTFHPGSSMGRTPADQARQKKVEDLKASMARLDAHVHGTPGRSSSTRVGGLRASASYWEC
ncbi:MAG TPA: hypothetical protein VLQ80_29730 [Candidatus Saccharimonadia bacterium]|nr:hypothetical protein [Candidatus Saccharimonadia bacterium]